MIGGDDSRLWVVQRQRRYQFRRKQTKARFSEFEKLREAAGKTVGKMFLAGGGGGGSWLS
jgi:hypothetical protein